jgi:hypothetical protein
MKGFVERHRPSPALVLSFIALLVALGGTAIALPGKKSIDKNDLKFNVVKTKNIKNGVVTTAKLGGEAVTAAKTADSVYQAATKGSFGSQGRGDGVGPYCVPAGTFIDCVSTNLNLPRNGKVLVNATTQWASVLAPGQGDCELRADGAPIAGTSADVGEDVDTTNVSAANTFASTAVTGVLGKGNHTFSLACTGDNDLFFHDGNITAVLIGT